MRRQEGGKNGCPGEPGQEPGRPPRGHGASQHEGVQGLVPAGAPS